MHSLTKKWHGLPVWAWAAIASVILFGVYYLYKKRTNSSASTNATPTDAGSASSLLPDDSGDSGSGGTLSTPDANTQLPANNPTPEEIINPGGAVNGLTPSLVGAIEPLSTGAAARAGEGTGGALNTPVPNKVASSSPLIPLTATATSLQTTVAKANSKDIFPATTAPNHPSAVKVAANKTGASANKKQGVFSIH